MAARAERILTEKIARVEQVLGVRMEMLATTVVVVLVVGVMCSE